MALIMLRDNPRQRERILRALKTRSPKAMAAFKALERKAAAAA